MLVVVEVQVRVTGTELAICHNVPRVFTVNNQIYASLSARDRLEIRLDNNGMQDLLHHANNESHKLSTMAFFAAMAQGGTKGNVCLILKTQDLARAIGYDTKRSAVPS